MSGPSSPIIALPYECQLNALPYVLYHMVWYSRYLLPDRCFVPDELFATPQIVQTTSSTDLCHGRQFAVAIFNLVVGTRLCEVRSLAVCLSWVSNMKTETWAKVWLSMQWISREIERSLICLDSIYLSISATNPTKSVCTAVCFSGVWSYWIAVLSVCNQKICAWNYVRGGACSKRTLL